MCAIKATKEVFQRKLCVNKMSGKHTHPELKTIFASSDSYPHPTSNERKFDFQLYIYDDFGNLLSAEKLSLNQLAQLEK